MPIPTGFAYSAGTKEAKWIKNDDFSQEADGAIFLGDSESIVQWVAMGIQTKGACAVVLDASKEQFLKFDDDGSRETKHRPLIIELPSARDKNAAPYQRRALLVQLGQDTVVYAPKYNTSMRPTPMYTPTSVVVYKSMASAQVFPGIINQKASKSIA